WLSLRHQDSAPLQHYLSSFDLSSQFLFIGQDRSILRRQHLVWESFQRIAGHGFIFPGAENQSDRWVFTFMDPMFPRIVEVEVHLARVRMSELADLQVNDHQTTQPSMEEEKVHAIPFFTDAQALLPAGETEIITQFQEEGLQMTD